MGWAPHNGAANRNWPTVRMLVPQHGAWQAGGSVRVEGRVQYSIIGVHILFVQHVSEE